MDVGSFYTIALNFLSKNYSSDFIKLGMCNEMGYIFRRNLNAFFQKYFYETWSDERKIQFWISLFNRYTE